MFYWPRESIWPVFSWKALVRVGGRQCSRRLAAGPKVTVSRSERCVCVGGVNHNHSPWVLASDKGVSCQPVTTPLHNLYHSATQSQASCRGRHCWKLFFFGHRPKCFWNDQKQLSHFGQNVWKYRLKNTATASVTATVRQMTEIFQWSKCLSKKWPKCLIAKNKQVGSFRINQSRISRTPYPDWGAKLSQGPKI